jgi:hypothetical protein
VLKLRFDEVAAFPFFYWLSSVAQDHFPYLWSALMCSSVLCVCRVLLVNKQDPANTHFHIPLHKSFIQKIRPGPRLIDPFRDEFVFYGEGLLAPHPTPKLEHHPLSFVRGCIFNIFAANLLLEAVPSIRNPRTRHAVVTRPT